MKPTGPQLTVVVFLVALSGYVFVGAPKLSEYGGVAEVAAQIGLPVGDDVVKDRDGRAVQKFPESGKKFIGITTKEGVYDFKEVDAFADATGHDPAVLMFNEGWVANEFDRRAFDNVAKRGMMPLLSWEPWNYKDDSLSDDGSHAAQPDYSLARIAAGDHDKYIKMYAKGIAGLDYEVGIRLAHEMNGFWYPWGVDVNGNKDGDYVKMWKHVRQIFKDAGADNVTWVWSPNVQYNGTTIKLKDLYPGDDQVDWIGVSGYYGTAGTEGYRKPADVFNLTLNELKTFSHRPIVITETGATNVDGRRTEWVGDFFDYLPQHPEIIGFIWYEAVKETDWRINQTPESAKAFGTEAKAALYDTPWDGELAPNTAAPVYPSSAAPSPSTSSSSSKKKKKKASPSASESDSSDQD